MCVSCKRLFIVLSKHHKLGILNSIPHLLIGVSNSLKLIPPCLFFQFGSNMLIVLIYVDNKLLIGTNPQLIAHLIFTLHSHFALKDLRDLHFFSWY